ncbi:DUF7146 domain-containing protein [Nitratireductor thuwali]|uniref:DNA primase/helicase Gp4 N-terminal Bacteriophage T7-like domain-containing protein n=1 Tax=Nitratireductor thuwali TaxID=2267699 RepID=A0ABY5MRN3_9HYPH|nr:hypothetical protein NTH_04032 [Nitratireductor thuwali]
MSEDLISRCQGMWRAILPALGIPETALTGSKCPCPICGGKDRFRFDDRKPTGSGSWICNQCGAGYGVHLIEKVNGWTRGQAFDAIKGVLGKVYVSPDASRPNAPDLKKMLAAGLAIWKAAVPPAAGNTCGRYLSGRGITEVADVTWLRHGDRVLYLDEAGEFYGRFSAMLAVVRGADGNVAGLHRTYLTSDGRKADVPSPRKLLGTMPEGAAVRLADHGEVLGIAEGVETALSATALFGIPCWSALNANGLRKWSPPDGATEIVIFGDNDTNFTGQSAAYDLANRLALKRMAVRVEIPPTPGDDWNDVLMKRGTA